MPFQEYHETNGRLAQSRSPIFIIGNPRSGTTLLRLLLTSHRRICIPPECGFAVWLFDKHHDYKPARETVPSSHGLNKRELWQIAAEICATRKFHTWKVNIDDVKEEFIQRKPQNYAEIVAAVYELYATKSFKVGARWGDKNNYYLNHIETIHTLFPDSVFIHIVRDCRDVVCSYREIASRTISSSYKPELPNDVAQAAIQWNANLSQIRRSFDALEWKNVLEITYESLVANATDELKRICLFLGEEFDQGMLTFFEGNRNLSLEPSEFLQWKEHTLKPVDESKVKRFKQELTQHELSTIESLAGETLKQYGYQN